MSFYGGIKIALYYDILIFFLNLKMSRRGLVKSPMEEAIHYISVGEDRDGLEKREVNEEIGKCLHWLLIYIWQP